MQSASDRLGEIYLPYVGHLSDQVMLLEDGSVMAMAHFPGIISELEDETSRNARYRALNALFGDIADDNVTICSHFVRHDASAIIHMVNFSSGFADHLKRAFSRPIPEGNLLRNDQFLTLIVSPRNSFGTLSCAIMHEYNEASNDLKSLICELENLWHVIVGVLGRYNVRRLGVRQKDGVTFTEIGEALRLILTCNCLPVAVTSGAIGPWRYTPRVFRGKGGVAVRLPSGTHFRSIFSVQEYPVRNTSGTLNTLHLSDFPLVVSQSFGFLARSQICAKPWLRLSQSLSSGHEASIQSNKWAQPENTLASNEFVMGSHHLSICIHARDMKSLADRSDWALAKLIDAGALAVQDRSGIEAAYWSQLPGNWRWRWRERPGALTFKNFADFISFDTCPMGSPVEERGSVTYDSDVSHMPKFVAVVLSHLSKVKLVDTLGKLFGEFPAFWLDKFMTRYVEAKAKGLRT